MLNISEAEVLSVTRLEEVSTIGPSTALERDGPASRPCAEVGR